MTKIALHPEIHASQDEQLRFILIDSYRFFVKLGNKEAAEITRLCNQRLSICILYGSADVLLRFWATQRTYDAVRAHVEARLEHFGGQSKCLTVNKTPLMGGHPIEPLEWNWRHTELLHQLRSAQHDWEGCQFRQEYQASGFCIPEKCYDPKNEVKAFITLCVPRADRNSILAGLLQGQSKIITAVHETDGEEHVVLEVLAPHGDSLWELTRNLRKVFSFFDDARAVTYVVPHQNPDRSHICGFEVLDQAANNQLLEAIRRWPEIESLRLDDQLKTAGELWQWSELLDDPGFGPYCDRLVKACIAKDYSFYSVVVELAEAVESGLREKLPRIASEHLGGNWLLRLRTDHESRCAERPERWMLDTLVRVISTSLKGTSIGVSSKETTMLKSFMEDRNKATHRRVDIGDVHHVLSGVRAWLEVLYRRRSDFGLVSTLRVRAPKKVVPVDNSVDKGSDRAS